LAELSGVILFANTGQEGGGHYASFDLIVLWIESIPEIFDVLSSTISTSPNQHSVYLPRFPFHHLRFPFRYSSSSLRNTFFGAQGQLFHLASVARRIGIGTSYEAVFNEPNSTIIELAYI
jgi:hypothetical protein